MNEGEAVTRATDEGPDRRCRHHGPFLARRCCGASFDPALSLLAFMVVLTASCRSSPLQLLAAETGAFDEFFRLGASVELQEAEEDPIGDIAILVECRNGDLLVGDQINVQVRRYDPAGRLLAMFGRYGEGPFEFRRIGALLENRDGGILVTDPRLGRVTVLTHDLHPDTSLLIRPAPRAGAFAMGEAVLLATAAGPRSTAFTLMDRHWRAVWSIPAPTPGTMRQYPYWDSYASIPAAVTSQFVVTAYSLRYPIYIYGQGGGLLDSLRSAPHSFRTAPVLPMGAFAGPDASRRQDEWLASFDILSNLMILQDSLLVVVHGVLRRTATSRAASEDRRLDVYHLPSRSKLAEDIPLPDSSRVLSGGGALYLLTAQPPRAWKIQQAEFVHVPRASGEGRR